MILGSFVFAAISAEAKTSSEKAASSVELNAAPQWQQRNRGWQNRRNNRTVRIVVRTVRRGRAIFRETYRVVTNRNGRTTTTLVSRVRVR